MSPTLPWRLAGVIMAVPVLGYGLVQVTGVLAHEQTTTVAHGAADAEFGRSLCHELGKHAVQAHGGEQQCGRGEE